MRTLTKPEYDVGDILDVCISNIASEDLSSRLMGIKPLLKTAASDYEIAATNSKLYKIKSTSGIAPNVTTDEMVNLYDQKLVKLKQPGRTIYEKIRSAPINDRCPLCAQRDVGSLDHYLPKTDFPAFAITAINLVPACSSCNKIKLKQSATTAEEQTLHPYFDDVENEPWLKAQVIDTSPASFSFYVDPPSHWDEILKSRTKHHFNLFKLAKLYVSHAADELTNIRGTLVDLHAKTGMLGVRGHLNQQARSRRTAHVNSWQTSTYQAMADSEWFCNSGFR